MVYWDTSFNNNCNNVVNGRQNQSVCFVLCIKILIRFCPQILTRRLRFRLERAPGESMLIDRTGRNLKMEPLSTVASLEKHLLKMVNLKEIYVFA